ncbi:MAG: type II toxin-antitoxin system HicB family antitoxin [Patescibacteria group bacterium]|jgi:predicted RNase H-like HicB family nuclease
MELKKYNVIFSEEADGGYSVSVPSLPGCFSQGDTFEEAIKNIKEAIELYLEGNEKKFCEIESENEFMVPVEVKCSYA